jgi:hypothetical protein
MGFKILHFALLLLLPRSSHSRHISVVKDLDLRNVAPGDVPFLSAFMKTNQFLYGLLCEHFA